MLQEYKLNFQRAGRLVPWHDNFCGCFFFTSWVGDRKATEAGHCYDTSSQYKITGKHRESGELTWRHDLRAPIPLITMLCMVLTCIDHLESFRYSQVNDPSKRHSMIFLTLLMAADSLTSRNLRRDSTVFWWHGHRISAAAMSHFGLAWHCSLPQFWAIS